MSRWFISRWRLARFSAFLGAGFYIVHGAVQLVWLRENAYFVDFEGFYHAAQALNAGRDPYAPFLRLCPHVIGLRACPGGSNLYLPLLSEAFRGLALLPEDTAVRIWLVFTHFVFLATVLVVYRMVRNWLTVGGLWLLAAATILFSQLHQNIYFLHMNLLLLLLLSIAAYFYVGSDAGSGRDSGLAGGVLAVATVLRATPAIVAPALLRARRWRQAVAAYVVTGAVLLAALVALTPYTIQWFTTVLPRLSEGSEIVQNQSLLGFSLRLQLALAGHVVGGARVVYTAIVAVLLAVTWLAARGAADARRRAVIFAAFLALSPIVSSLTWDIHLVSELLVLALIAPALSPFSWRWWAAVAAYLLLWIPRVDLISLQFHHPEGAGLALYLLVTSVNLWGMVLLWLVCLACARSRADIGNASTEALQGEPVR